MRQNIGEKKLRRYARRFPDLDIVGAMVRGGTEHRVDLLLRDMTIAYLWPDGTITRDGDRWGSIYAAEDLAKHPPGWWR